MHYSIAMFAKICEKRCDLAFISLPVQSLMAAGTGNVALKWVCQ